MNTCSLGVAGTRGVADTTQCLHFYGNRSKKVVSIYQVTFTAAVNECISIDFQVVPPNIFAKAQNLPHFLPHSLYCCFIHDSIYISRHLSLPAQEEKIVSGENMLLSGDESMPYFIAPFWLP